MKQPMTKPSPTRTGVQRILVPVNFTDASIRAVDYAAKLARPIGGVITLLHVVETDRRVPDSESLQDPVLKKAQETAEKKLQRFASFFVGNQIATEIVVGAGGLLEQILSEIREMNPDLVVVTSRHRRTTRWFWQRDTTLELFECAPCPVVVLRDFDSGIGDLLLY